MNYSYALMHHGIKGQRWGVRRTPAQLGHKTGRKTKESRMSDDAKKVASIKKKKVYEMSNQEIRDVNNRMQLEQQYSRLNPNAMKKGMAFVAGAAVTTNTILNLYNNSDKLAKLAKKGANFVQGIISR